MLDRSKHTRMQRTGLILGPTLFLAALLFLDLAPDDPVPTRMAAVALLMATWWGTDAIPLFATSLLPMVLLQQLSSHLDLASSRATCLYLLKHGISTGKVK